MARGKLSILQVVVDLFLLILVLLGSALYYRIGKPFKRGFYCDDETIKYPYKESTVSNTLLYIIAVVIPFVLIVLIEITVFKFFRTYTLQFSFCSELTARVYKVSTSFLFGAAVTHFIVDVTKYSVGRLRPHFLAVCMPDESKFNCSEGYITEEVCSGGQEDMIKAARVSFPSGHAALTLYGMVFLMLYIRARFTCRFPRLLKPFLMSGCLMVGVYVSVSRIFDYKHHPGDVAVGALFGSAVALVFGVGVAGLSFGNFCYDPVYYGSPPTVIQSSSVNNMESHDSKISIVT